MPSLFFRARCRKMQQITSAETQHRGTELRKVTIRPKDSLLCAERERVMEQMGFFMYDSFYIFAICPLMQQSSKKNIQDAQIKTSSSTRNERFANGRKVCRKRLKKKKPHRDYLELEVKKRKAEPRMKCLRLSGIFVLPAATLASGEVTLPSP